MDPTKSFDHLDPKLKETYARVMGTATNGDAAPAATTPPAPSSLPDPSLSATPTADFGTPPPPAEPNIISPSPFDATAATIPTQTGPNPGTGPTISTMPTDPSMAAPSSWDPAAINTPSTDLNSPPNSSFFSNPSPAIADSSQPFNGDTTGMPVEPLTEPVTPYAPQEQLAQPLPSPATVNQATEHTASPLLKVLYIVGAVIFFAIYTIFWIKIFNLPFLF